MGLLGSILFGAAAGGSMGSDAIVDGACIYFWLLKNSNIFEEENPDELELNLTLGALDLACENIRYNDICGIPIGGVIMHHTIDGSQGNFIKKFVGFEISCLRLAACVYHNKPKPEIYESSPCASDRFEERWEEASKANDSELVAMLKRFDLDKQVEANAASIPYYGYQQAISLREAMKMAGINLTGKSAVPEHSRFQAVQNVLAAKQFYKDAYSNFTGGNIRDAYELCQKAIQHDPEHKEAAYLKKLIEDSKPEFLMRKGGRPGPRVIIKCKHCGRDVASDSEKCWCCDAPIE